MFRLERPNMAVNDKRVRDCGSFVRFQMWNTWDIDAAEKREQIVRWVAKVARSANGGQLKHLVLSCHGEPGAIQLGQGFDLSHVPLFAAWAGLIAKIWLVGCEVARIPDPPPPKGLHHHSNDDPGSCQIVRVPDPLLMRMVCDRPGVKTGDGNLFCSELAKTVRCHVVVSTEIQCSSVTDVPPDMMTSFEGLTLSFGPKGDITWSSRNKSTWMRTDPATGTQQCVLVPD